MATTDTCALEQSENPDSFCVCGDQVQSNSHRMVASHGRSTVYDLTGFSSLASYGKGLLQTPQRFISRVVLRRSMADQEEARQTESGAQMKAVLVRHSVTSELSAVTRGAATLVPCQQHVSSQLPTRTLRHSPNALWPALLMSYAAECCQQHRILRNLDTCAPALVIHDDVMSADLCTLYACRVPLISCVWVLG